MHTHYGTLAALCWLVVIALAWYMESSRVFQKRARRDMSIPFFAASLAVSTAGTLLTLTSLRSTLVGIACLLIALGVAYLSLRFREVLRTLAAYCIGGVFLGIIIRVLIGQAR